MIWLARLIRVDITYYEFVLFSHDDIHTYVLGRMLILHILIYEASSELQYRHNPTTDIQCSRLPMAHRITYFINQHNQAIVTQSLSNITFASYIL